MSEQEKSEELVALEEIAGGVGVEIQRLKGLHTKGKLRENLAEELLSTVLPLVEDLAAATYSHAEATEEWASEIDEVVGEGNGPSLNKEEIKLFGWLFQRLNDFVGGIKSNPDTPDEMKQGAIEIEIKLSMAMGILEKFVEVEDGEESSKLEEVEDSEDGDVEDANE